jgi:phage I-like protein
MRSITLPLSNRAGFTPAGELIHVVPFGRYPERETGIVQVIDMKAVHSMVNDFNEQAKKPNFLGLLLDADHFSYNPEKSSEAYGWITELVSDDDGIWARVRWTDVGEAALQSGRYRLVSPAWMPQDTETVSKNEIRPLRLHSVALTNAPNMKGMVPISNRRTNENESDDNMTEEQAARLIKTEADGIRAVNNRMSWDHAWALAESRQPGAAKVIANANRSRVFPSGTREVCYGNRDDATGFDPNHFASGHAGHPGDAGVRRFLKRFEEVRKQRGSFANAWAWIQRYDVETWQEFQRGIAGGFAG